MSENPYLFRTNEEIRFADIQPKDATAAVEKAVAVAKNELTKIYNCEHLTFENTLLAFDSLVNAIVNTYGAIYLVAFTHTEDEIRTEAQQNIPQIQRFFNEIQLDEQLYAVIKSYSETEEAKSLTNDRKKFLTETLADFERNGFALPQEKREEVKEIKNKLSELSSKFDANIAAFEDELLLEKKDADGLPEDYLNARLQEDGRYKIDLSYPSYRPFMKYATSDEARKQLMFKFLNRASEQNDQLLREIIELRQELSQALGYTSFAAYNLENKMAKTAQQVWDFEQELQEKVKIKANFDYDELLNEKKKSDPKAQKVNSWESAFYENKLLLNTYSIDEQEVKQYFELNNVIRGLFRVCEILFSVEFVEIKQASTWHEDVRYYAVIEQDKEIGHFYLDLFPRKNKFGHAAMFPIVSGKLSSDGYETPKAALVCNFPKPTEEMPSLLTHGDVETFFHEFGHLLHGLLTTTELSSQAGTSVSRDFVETPSQMFEQWAWNYDSLKHFAKHYKTDEVLPLELHKKMIASKNVNSGNHYLQQIFYGNIDMTLHDRWSANKNKTFSDILKELQESITKFDYIPGTHMHASFGHLNGYAAGYYGYLWAKVFAEDFFSVFEKEGVMNSELGMKYREKVLATGSSVEPMEIVEGFLGRKPEYDAFLRNIGLTKQASN